MGKHKSGKINVQKKDVFQRLNYLYQTAHIALSMKPPNTDLVKHYTNTMVSLALKNVVRLSPHIKRTLCKCCHMLLMPGVTCKVRRRGKSKKSKRLTISCLECGTIKRFLLNPNHSLWNDKPENILQIISMNESPENQSVNTSNIMNTNHQCKDGSYQLLDECNSAKAEPIVDDSDKPISETDQLVPKDNIPNMTVPEERVNTPPIETDGSSNVKSSPFEKNSTLDQEKL